MPNSTMTLVHVGGNQAPNLYCSLPSCSEGSHVGGEITMPCEAPTIRLSESQREVVESITRRGTNPQQLVRRARIILLSDRGLTNAAISEQVGYERHQVGCWRSLWAAKAECLGAAETEEPPKAFAAMIEQVLSDATCGNLKVYGRASYSDRSGGLRRSRELRSSGHPLDRGGIG